MNEAKQTNTKEDQQSQTFVDDMNKIVKEPTSLTSENKWRCKQANEIGAWEPDGKESTCQCRRREFDPWVGKIPWMGQGMATHSSILAWRIPWTEEPGGLYSPRGLKESATTMQLTNKLRTVQVLKWWEVPINMKLGWNAHLLEWATYQSWHGKRWKALPVPEPSKDWLN